MQGIQLNTTVERSLLMSKIKSSNTKPELRLRKALWALGLRYRTNFKKLPGTPDIFIKKYRLVIFIDGEFWHGKDWESKKTRIKSNPEFWIKKIENNIKRDSEANQNLESMGYKVMRFWSLEVNKKLGACIKEILDYIESFDIPNI